MLRYVCPDRAGAAEVRTLGVAIALNHCHFN
jgi:hypothetical protein